MKNKRLEADQYIEEFSLKNFLMLCLSNWKWFLVSIVLFVGMGLFYVYTRQPVYERFEEILVKDQDTGNGVGDVSNSFTQLGLFSNNTKVYNELIALTTPAVMQQVVDRLNLAMNYTEKDGLKRRTLYGTSLPIDVTFPDLSDNDQVGFRLYIEPDGSYVIKRMTRILEGVEKIDGEVEGKIDGGAVKTPIGTIDIKTNPYFYSDKIQDETLVIDVFKQAEALAVEKYSAMLKGDLTDQDADVIKLSINDTSIERADDILNMVVQIYNERWMEDKNKVAIATSKFIDERLAGISLELGGVDEKISDIKSDLRIPDLEEAAKGFLAEGFQLNQDALQATNMLAMGSFLKEYLEDPANNYNVVPLNTGTENVVLEEQIGKYNELLLLRNNLVANSSERNPKVQDYDKQLAGMRASLLRSVETHIINLKNAIANIAKAQNANKGMLSSSPKQAKNLLKVERQQQVMEELYLFLLQKKEENELTQSFTAENTYVITPPYGTHLPISPKKTLILIIAFFLGAGIPAAALYIAETSNDKVRSKKDLENIPVPFAGEIPLIGKSRKWLKVVQTKKKKQKEIDKPKIVVAEGKRDIPNEAFRVVRSNLDLMIGRGQKAVLALTSFNPGSGKSFVAYNLGASFALKGKKVLIIDGDLRHGSISTYVNSPRKGLATYLSGNSNDWENLVVRVPDASGLEVLPIGYRPPNPAELLESSRLEELIARARNEYDVVLIDCPPVNIVVDTQIINQYVDRTIFVVRAGLLEKAAINDLINLVDEQKFRNVTVLLNGTTTEFSSYHTYGNYEAIDKI